MFSLVFIFDFILMRVQYAYSFFLKHKHFSQHLFSNNERLNCNATDRYLLLSMRWKYFNECYFYKWLSQLLYMSSQRKYMRSM